MAPWPPAARHNGPRTVHASKPGEGAPAPTVAQLRELAADARTPAEHRVLAEYYTTLADQQTTAAQRYAGMAQTYRAQVRKGGGDPAIHFDLMAKRSREAANQARGEAAKHAQVS